MLPEILTYDLEIEKFNEGTKMSYSLIQIVYDCLEQPYICFTLFEIPMTLSDSRHASLASVASKLFPNDYHYLLHHCNY